MCGLLTKKVFTRSEIGKNPRIATARNTLLYRIALKFIKMLTGCKDIVPRYAIKLSNAAGDGIFNVLST
ncbi:MAG: hypothetical protein COB10_06715 [Planctomycetota bacterium]|nr:MAG: hypothetical protein COB10_06715 [Planctomycetota bacterium]